jgi:hypothetical protein
LEIFGTFSRRRSARREISFLVIASRLPPG